MQMSIYSNEGKMKNPIIVPRLTIPANHPRLSAQTFHGEMQHSTNVKPKNIFMSTNANTNDYDSVQALTSPRVTHNQTMDKFGTIELMQDSIMTNTTGTAYDPMNSTLVSVRGHKKNVTIFMPAED